MLEIAARAGYDSYSFFQKRFKQKFGRTPKAYRKSSNDSII
jgi:AraC-like DNA-binding protein